MAIENHVLVDLIRHDSRRSHSVKAFAKKLGFTDKYIYAVFAGTRPVGKRLAGLYGYIPLRTHHIMFRKKGEFK